jgi:hypothetical protein
VLFLEGVPRLDAGMQDAAGGVVTVAAQFEIVNVRTQEEAAARGHDPNHVRGWVPGGEKEVPRAWKAYGSIERVGGGWEEDVILNRGGCRTS